MPNQSDQTNPKLSKAESARINGSKSQGATSPEGKIRAANGNLKHGIYSSRVVMENENMDAYQTLYACFVELFQPRDAFEGECVTTMANTRWRLRRLEAAETANLDVAVVLNKPYIEARWEAIDVPHERALAIQAESANLERMTRVEERLHRLYERNFKLLTTYRRKSGCAMPESVSESASVSPAETHSQQDQPHPQADATILTDPPNSQPAPGVSAASIISKVAMFLVIFSMLLLAPARISAKYSSFSTFDLPVYPSHRVSGGTHTSSSPLGVQK